MNQSPPKSESEFKSKLQWLLFVRLLFSSLLLGSTIILQFGENASSFAPPLLLLYGIIISIFILSFVYAIVLNYIKRYAVFAFLQVSADTFIVSLIIFVTGSFASVFSFLYLVVIIYSSMLLSRRATIFVAALCGIQFGIMVDLEYYGFITPFSMGPSGCHLCLESSAV